MKKMPFLLLLFVVLFAFQVQAQLTLSPAGDNQKSVTTQYMGLASVSVAYSSPDIHLPDGTDRTGKIWGQLVPYGLANLGFGNSTAENPSPWRAGANENTTITFSHDVQVEGSPLKAGTYGLHMIPGETEWTVIFSNNTSSWGSYFYDAKEDALRVTVKPEKGEYNEWLTYEFSDRKQNGCTVQLKWENLSVPFKIAVPNGDDLYVQSIRNELRSQKGFAWQNLMSAANWCAARKLNLEEALGWSNRVINQMGQKNFPAYQTKANVLVAMGKQDDANTVLEEAIKFPDANANQINNYGRQLIAQKKADKALEVFKYNAERFPTNTFVVKQGLARGYSAKGDYKTALKYANEALAAAPNPGAKTMIEGLVKKLEAGQDVN